jgi:hypothetical protein
VEQWLVMSNCQTMGLANCIQAQTPEVAVTALDPGMFKARPMRLNARMGKFDKLLIYPGIRPEVGRAKLERIAAHVELPIVTFRAYHPDLIYIFDRGRPLSGPLSHYHSAIAFACHRKGLAVADAQGYFNGAFYETCGYLDLWARERDRLLAEFDACGLDIRTRFRNWGRERAFMYSYNHPRIGPLYDMASALLSSAGLEPRRSDLIPQDNLASSAIFAVYPEIGEALGVAGNYEFRAVGDYRPMGLREYLTRCYALYDSLPAENLTPFPEFRDQVDRISNLL